MNEETFIKKMMELVVKDFSSCMKVDQPRTLTLTNKKTGETKQKLLKLVSIQNFDELYEHIAIIVSNLENEYIFLPEQVEKFVPEIKKIIDIQASDPVSETITELSELKFTNLVYLYTDQLHVPKEKIIQLFKESGLKLEVRDGNYRQRLSEMSRTDVFICHDSFDKKSFVEPLYRALTTKGVKVWYDEFSLEIGDSLIDKIEEGLRNCNYGIMIVSKNFLQNWKWPHIEFKSLKTREISSGKKIILPIWRSDVSKQDVENYSLDLSDKLAGLESDGIDKIVEKILRVLKK